MAVVVGVGVRRCVVARLSELAETVIVTLLLVVAWAGLDWTPSVGEGFGTADGDGDVVGSGVAGIGNRVSWPDGDSEVKVGAPAAMLRRE